MIKTSIRFFEDIPVRAVWDDETSKWRFCAMDIAEALTRAVRSYLNALKRRKLSWSTNCRQPILKGRGKFILASAFCCNNANRLSDL